MRSRPPGLKTVCQRIAAVKQPTVEFQLELPRCLGRSRQKIRHPLANLAARAIANSVRTLHDRLSRSAEDDIKENGENQREPEQAQSKDLAQRRFHKFVPV